MTKKKEEYNEIHGDFIVQVKDNKLHIECDVNDFDRAFRIINALYPPKIIPLEQYFKENK